MDTGPFVTWGLGPTGQHIRYYNLDVQPVGPARIFVIFREGEDHPVTGLGTASTARQLGFAGNVNCPIVFVLRPRRERRRHHGPRRMCRIGYGRPSESSADRPVTVNPSDS